MKIYHGNNPIQTSDNWYSPDKEFARNFTQSFKDTEIDVADISKKDIYRMKKPPLGTHAQGIDAAIKEAKSRGYKAVFIDEGKYFPKSVLVLDKSILSSAQGAYKKAMKLGLKALPILGAAGAIAANPVVGGAQEVLTNVEDLNPNEPMGSKRIGERLLSHHQIRNDPRVMAYMNARGK